MGYKYENRLEEANEAEYWRTRPKWQRRFHHAIRMAFCILFAGVSLVSFILSVYRLFSAMF